MDRMNMFPHGNQPMVIHHDAGCNNSNYTPYIQSSSTHGSLFGISLLGYNGYATNYFHRRQSGVNEDGAPGQGPGTMITEVLGDIDELFDDEAAPRSAPPSVQHQAYTREYAQLAGPTSHFSIPSSLLTGPSFAAVDNHPSTRCMQLVYPSAQASFDLKRTINETSEPVPQHSDAVTENSEWSASVSPSPAKKARRSIPAPTDALFQPREVSIQETSSDLSTTSGDSKFRSYQMTQWSASFEELCAFKSKHGHSQVPHSYKANQPLARWVKRQRYQFKLKAEGKPATITAERIKTLEDIGFVWDSHGCAWDDRYNDLKRFKKERGHCNVPSNHPANPRLATWVKAQRRQYKLFWQGKASNITLHRIQQLHEIGFEWALRGQDKNLFP